MEGTIHLPYTGPEMQEEGNLGNAPAAMLPGMQGLLARGASSQGMADVSNDEQSKDATHILDRAITSMLTRLTRKLKQILSRHVAVSTSTISALLPELLYYIYWAEYVEKAAESRLCHGKNRSFFRERKEKCTPKGFIT